jgi:hypothetical protein
VRAGLNLRKPAFEEGEYRGPLQFGSAETFRTCRRPVFPVKYWVSASGKFPVVSEDDMLRKTSNESSEPVVGRLGIEEYAQRRHLV